MKPFMEKKRFFFGLVGVVLAFGTAIDDARIGTRPDGASPLVTARHDLHGRTLVNPKKVVPWDFRCVS